MLAHQESKHVSKLHPTDPYPLTRQMQGPRNALQRKQEGVQVRDMERAAQ